MQKIDFSYQETKTNEKIRFKGPLLLRASAPCALFLFDGARETLVGYAASFDVSAPDAKAFLIEAPKGVRVFRRHTDDGIRKGSGKPFTNADRRPTESGALAEVQRATRELELTRRAARAEGAALLAQLRAQRAPTPDDQITEDGEVIETEVKTE